MRMPWRHLLRQRNGLPVALWMLLLLSANALQVVATSHWHSSASSVAIGTDASPDAPVPDGIDHDGCLLCQVASHVGASAPPPAPWTIFTVVESQAAQPPAIRPEALQLRPSHSWQGRAPPLV